MEGGNDYVVAVKANQKRLYKQIQLNTQQTTPISVDISTEHRSARLTTRTVSVFDNLTDISSEWVGLERLVKVERIGQRLFFHHHGSSDDCS